MDKDTEIEVGEQTENGAEEELLPKRIAMSVVWKFFRLETNALSSKLLLLYDAFV